MFKATFRKIRHTSTYLLLVVLLFSAACGTLMNTVKVHHAHAHKQPTENTFTQKHTHDMGHCETCPTTEVIASFKEHPQTIESKQVPLFTRTTLENKPLLSSKLGEYQTTLPPPDTLYHFIQKLLL